MPVVVRYRRHDERIFLFALISADVRWASLRRPSALIAVKATAPMRWATVWKLDDTSEGCHLDDHTSLFLLTSGRRYTVVENGEGARQPGVGRLMHAHT